MSFSGEIQYRNTLSKSYGSCQYAKENEKGEKGLKKQYALPMPQQYLEVFLHESFFIATVMSAGTVDHS